MGDIEAPTVGRNCSNSFGCVGRLLRLDEACTHAWGDEGDELVRELDEPERPARSPRPAPDPLSLAGSRSCRSWPTGNQSLAPTSATSARPTAAAFLRLLGLGSWPNSRHDRCCRTRCDDRTGDRAG